MADPARELSKLLEQYKDVDVFTDNEKVLLKILKHMNESQKSLNARVKELESYLGMNPEK